ncbi:hypothetical protein Tco_0985913 [Tanacetum coccineum]
MEGNIRCCKEGKITQIHGKIRTKGLTKRDPADDSEAANTEDPNIHFVESPALAPPKNLMDLRIERLILPAVSSALHTWTTSFGFSIMDDVDKLNYLDYTVLNFQSTTMCYKLLKKGRTFYKPKHNKSGDADGNVPLTSTRLCTCYKQNHMEVATGDDVFEKRIADFAHATRALRDRLQKAQMLYHTDMPTIFCTLMKVATGKEVYIGLGRGRDKLLRPADMLLYSLDRWLDICVNLTRSSPFTQTGMINFVPGRAMIKAAQHKHVKYEAKCANIGYSFLPFSFSSFGELEHDAVSLLKRIRKFSVAQDIEARADVHIFNRITFAIARGVGAQIVF